ncbi:PD-(D/E)XK motif protein [uncultured Litoreibacter sp.]|uniref:PD-(D/E)XK motif protein n=1 Tax=uncultured Litoreibacter sp. TaxID=1392394 RepID=UPI0026369D15|nr:PD-(D/E)XK motif protein [uncultured Litoreibacter sp.]
MLSDAPNPEEAWKRLRSGQQGASGLSIPTVPSDVKTLDGAVRHALGPQGEARLLVPIGMHERLSSFTESPALNVSEATYHQDGRPVRFIDLTCKVSELDSVFAEVGAELLKRIQNGNPAQGAVRSTLQDFRALLLRPPPKEISDAEIIGLVGELVVLCRLLQLNAHAVEAWRGPAGERHDFRNGGAALEVKTSTRASDQRVCISAIDQLDPPAGGTLHLAHLVLEQDVNGDLTVSSKAKDARALALDPAAILGVMEQIGCTDPDAQEWNRLAFSEESLCLYDVRDEFPRINKGSFKSGSMPNGVTKIEYIIDLSHAEEFALDDTESGTAFNLVAK